MTDFETRTLVAFTLGELPPEREAAIRRAAATNRELSAKLDALGGCAGIPHETTPTEVCSSASRFVPVPDRSRRRFVKQIAASVAGAIFLGGAGFAGYEWLREKPLFEDNFNDHWLDTRRWNTHRGRKGIREEGGALRLLNRGSLVTNAEFVGPIEIELDWQWIDLEGDPLYPDYLIVCLRTSGFHDDHHPFYPRDGIELVFNPHHGGVYVVTDVRDKPVLFSDPGILKFAAGKWYHLRITDDGRRIAIFASGPEIDKRFGAEPVLVYEHADRSTENRVAFYNREYVANTNHESRIDNVVIRRLRPK